ncbi:MAG: hypothetical protein ABJH98_09760 [Reichenbachiella sp.]|uniref:hypothetical protein n=1 Tax=Reichenbachiella sp. TaxID=2184521 RepID=UPI00329A4533
MKHHSHQLFIIFYSVLFTITLNNCATTHPLVLDAVWENANYEPRNYRKVAVFGMSKNLKNKKAFENDAVKYLKKKGVPAVAGYTIFDHEPEGNDVNRTDIKIDLYSQGFDGVLAVSSVENISQDDDDITDEELANHAEGIYKFGQYFEARYDHLQSDVDHSHHKYSILEANFYYLMDYNEFDGNGLVWISHFKYDLEKKTDVAIEIDNYAHVIINALVEDQVILER